jgi:hypothetical protein
MKVTVQLSLWPLYGIQASERTAPRILNSAQIRGVWSVSGPGHFTPSKEALVPTDYEAEWAQELVWKLLEEQNLLVLPGTKP